MPCWIVDFFNLVFFQRLVATVIGVLLGGLIALGVNRRSQRNSDEAEKKKASDEIRKRRIQALKATKDAISNNAARIKLAVEYLKAGGGPFFNVDPQEMDFLIPELLKADVDFGLFQEINSYRYELVHFARKIDTHYEMTCHPQFSTPSRLGEVMKSIIAHSEALIPMAEKLKEAIGTQLKKEEVI